MDKPRIIVSDFDGVICDSIEECFTAAHNAYLYMESQRLRKQIRFRSSKRLKQYFMLNRYLVRPAREYFVLFRYFKQFGSKSLSEHKFRLLVKEYYDQCVKFENEFYKTRVYIRSNYKKRWFTMNRIYPDVVSSITKLRKNFTFYILTTKDKKSVKMLLSKNALRIEDRFIYSKEKSLSKVETVRNIMRENGCRPSDIWFIDDNITYLTEVSRLKTNCCLAKWGYISSDAVRLSRKNGFQIFNNYRHTAEFLLGGRYI